MTDPTMSPPEFWETFYREERGRWSGNANASLVAEVADLTPGTALDVGCGQGGDAIWLATQGWTATGVDISAVALETAARDAAAAGVADAVTWERHDLAETFPAGTFDLVATSYLHSPVALPRTAILHAAAAAVAPGGTLLVVGHAPSASHPHHDLPGPDAVLAELALPEDAWRVRTSELRTFAHAFRDAEPEERTDAVVRVERRG